MRKNRVLAQKFLTSFLSCQRNAWTDPPYSSIMWCFDGAAFLNQGVRKFLEKSLTVSFDWPHRMKEGVLYLAFNREANGILYKVRYQKKSHQGKIVEEKYQSLKNKLSQQGSLSLREVNFLIETEIAPRGDLPYFCEVHDPLMLHYFEDFLTQDLSTQKEVLKLLSHLQPFYTFGYELPTALVLDPLS